MTAQNRPADFQVIGYLYTQSLEEVDRIQYAKLTQVNYSFVQPTVAGGLTEVDGAVVSRLVKRAHENGVKVGMAVGGWNDGDTSGFEAMAASPEYRAKFIGNLMALVERYDLDGIDMDWEYPNEASSADFLALMRGLSEKLRPVGKLLTLAVIAEGDEHGRFIPKEVFGIIDALNIMSYDWKYQSGAHHSPYEVAESSLDYWVSRGCPKEKAVLGVPFYGRSPTAALTYRQILAKDAEAPGKDESDGVLYNGLAAMRRKTELARRKGGGIMFWELTQDTSDAASLLGAIDETVRGFRA
ncbi:MAG: Chitinase [Fibrobacteres bacterium]|nr:Chitinase [Fibrobacterota bacterium]